MIALQFSPRALSDIESIWEYTAEEWGVEQADDYLLALHQTIGLLRLNPRLGRDMSDVGPGYFKFPTASHAIYYRLNSGTLYIVRILHKRMDMERNL